MSKRIVSLFITLVIVISLLPITPAQAASINIGDYVVMGKYYDDQILWRCMDIDENGSFTVTNEEILPYTLSNMYFTDTEGTPITSFNPNEITVVNLDITDNYVSILQDRLIIVSYDEFNAVQDIEIIKVDIDAGDTQPFSAEFTLQEGDTIKAFVWDMYVGMKPLSNTLSYSYQEEYYLDIEVLASDIYYNTTLEKVVYWENGDAPYLNMVYVDESAVVYYNHKVLDTLTDEDLKPHYGKLRMIDSTGDGKIDILFIFDIEQYVVDTIDVQNSMVYDKYDNAPLQLPVDSSEYTVNIFKKGNIITMDDVNEWDVLTVAESKDGKLINIEVIDEKIVGMVQEIYMSDFYEIFIFINNRYYIVPDYLDPYDFLGEIGTFYLGYMGEVVAAQIGVGEVIEYEYLLEAGINTEDQNAEFTFLGATEPKISETQIIFNAEVVNAAEVVEYLQDMEGNTKQQVIRYTYDISTDIIKAIDTANVSGYNQEPYINEGLFSKDRSIKEAEYSTYYECFEQQYNVNWCTKIFFIPEHGDKQILTPHDLSDFGRYDIELYDIDADGNLAAIIITDYIINVVQSDSIVLVEQITLRMSKQGVINGIYGIQNGERIERVTTHDFLDGNVGPDSILQIHLNQTGDVEQAEILFKPNGSQHFVNEQNNTAYGIVDAVTNNSITVYVEGHGTVTYEFSNTNVYKVQGDVLDITTVSDVEVSDNVFVRKDSENDIIEVVVYRGVY
jgi:hypothetical protein